MTTFYSIEFYDGIKLLGNNISKSPDLKDANRLVRLIKKAQPELVGKTVVILKRENNAK